MSAYSQDENTHGVWYDNLYKNSGLALDAKLAINFIYHLRKTAKLKTVVKLKKRDRYNILFHGLKMCRLPTLAFMGWSTPGFAQNSSLMQQTRGWKSLGCCGLNFITDLGLLLAYLELISYPPGIPVHSLMRTSTVDTRCSYAPAEHPDRKDIYFSSVVSARRMHILHYPKL